MEHNEPRPKVSRLVLLRIELWCRLTIDVSRVVSEEDTSERREGAPVNSEERKVARLGQSRDFLELSAKVAARSDEVAVVVW